MDTDIRDELDRSFSDGPAHTPLDVSLASGRRALRRRRLLVATVAAGVVVVAGGTWAVGSSSTGPAPDSRDRVAVDPSQPPEASATPEPAWGRAEMVRYVGGELVVRPDITVHARVDNPFGYAAPDRSDALDLTFRGQRTWVLAELVDGGLGYSAQVPSNGWADFDAWVADQAGRSGDGWPATMRRTGDGRVVAAPGAEVLQRTDDPQLGEAFAPADAPTGAAVVRVDGETAAYFVVWRVVDGELEVITTPPRDVVGATFEELLTYARGQYSSGEGLR